MKHIFKFASFGAVALAATFAGAPAEAAAVASRDVVVAARSDTIVKVDRRGRRTAAIVGAGVLGLAAGAAIAGSSRDRVDEEYYDEPRRVYVERPRYRERCEYVRYRENRYGEIVRVVTYRPC